MLASNINILHTLYQFFLVSIMEEPQPFLFPLKDKLNWIYVCTVQKMIHEQIYITPASILILALFNLLKKMLWCVVQLLGK